MNHLLIPIDGTIPNLALMKISRYLKSRGDHVDLAQPTIPPDEVWVSAIFTWNRARAEQVAQYWEQIGGAIVHFGGTAFDWGHPHSDRIELPPEIEELDPDYTLFNDDRAVGYCNRGCNRNCKPFCDVPNKEGKIRKDGYRRILGWVPPDISKVLLLDNDIALYERKMHDQIITDCRDTGRKLCITQGYDARTLDPRTVGMDGNWTYETWKDDVKGRAQLLAENKPWNRTFKYRTLYFSWDFMGIEPAVRRAIETLKDAGFKGREMMVYTIVGVDDGRGGVWPSHEENLYRYKALWEEYGVYPYVMIFNNRHDLEWERAFLRWVNKRIHKSCSWEEYRQNPERYEPPSDEPTLSEWMPEWGL